MIAAKAGAVIAMAQIVLHIYWPAHPFPEAIVGQAERENPRFDPRLENRNPRNNGEIGVGVLQITRTNSFDNFAAARSLAPELRDWQWDDRFDLRKQVVAGVLMDKQNYGRCVRVMAPTREAYGCTLAAYNAGFGRVLINRRLCANMVGCDARKWFGNTENMNSLGTANLRGYHVSAYAITHTYASDIMNVRAPKYARFFH